MEEVGERGVSEKRTFCSSLPQKCHTLGFYPGPPWSVAGGLALHGASKLTSISAPCSGMMDRLPTGPLKVAGTTGRSWGGYSNSFPLVWDEGFLFSVPAVFLLFNLNIQLLHHSHIPESGSRLQWQLGPPGTTWKSLHLHFSGCSPFSVQPGTLVSRAGARFLRVSMGRGCQVLLVGLSKPPQMGYVNTIEFPAPTQPSLSHQCVKCNDLFNSKPIPPAPTWGLVQALPPSPLYQLPGS